MDCIRRPMGDQGTTSVAELMHTEIHTAETDHRPADALLISVSTHFCADHSKPVQWCGVPIRPCVERISGSAVASTLSSVISVGGTRPGLSWPGEVISR